MSWAVEQAKGRIRSEIREDINLALAYASHIKDADVQVRLPIKASRESATWKINEKGVVTSYIDFTVGSGVGEKWYATGLVVEYADGSTDTRFAKKGVGRPGFGTRTGTAKKKDHDALDVDKLDQIRRVYVKYAKGSDSPGTIREWIDKILGWADEAEEIYKRLEENDLVEDAIAFYLAG